MVDSWLTPKGELIKVGYCGHNDYATELLMDEFKDIVTLMNYLESHGGNRSPYEELHRRGWIRVKFRYGRVEFLGGCTDLTKPMRNTIDPPMNRIQWKVAKRLCLEHKTLFHEAINDKRFW